MAFTGDQKTRIRHYLGYPQVYLYANTRLESAIERVEADADAKALALEVLAKLVAAEDSYLDGLKVAGVRTLDKDDVGYFNGNEVIKGRAEIGRRLCGELSILFGVQLANDVFSGRGYQGDAWKNGRAKLAGIS